MACCEEAEQALKAWSTDSRGCEGPWLLSWLWSCQAQGARVCPQLEEALGPVGGREGWGKRAQGHCLALSPATSGQPSPPPGLSAWLQPESTTALPRGLPAPDPCAS